MNILLIGTYNGAPNSSEIALISWLEGIGHTVTLRGYNDADKSVTGFDLLWVLDTAVNSSTNTLPYANLSIGTLSNNNAFWGPSYAKWSTGNNGVSQSDLGVLYILDSPVNTYAGQAVGATLGFSSVATGRSLRVATQLPPGHEATLIAQQNNSSDIDWLVWGFESGSLLSDLVTPAAARMVGWGPSTASVSLMNADTLSYLAKVLEWAAGITTEPVFTVSVVLDGVEVPAGILVVSSGTESPAKVSVI